jgi:hypothetical protein
MAEESKAPDTPDAPDYKLSASMEKKLVQLDKELTELALQTSQALAQNIFFTLVRYFGEKTALKLWEGKQGKFMEEVSRAIACSPRIEFKKQYIVTPDTIADRAIRPIAGDRTERNNNGSR